MTAQVVVMNCGASDAIGAVRDRAAIFTSGVDTSQAGATQFHGDQTAKVLKMLDEAGTPLEEQVTVLGKSLRTQHQARDTMRERVTTRLGKESQGADEKLNDADIHIAETEAAATTFKAAQNTEIEQVLERRDYPTPTELASTAPPSAIVNGSDADQWKKEEAILAQQMDSGSGTDYPGELGAEDRSGLVEETSNVALHANMATLLSSAANDSDDESYDPEFMDASVASTLRPISIATKSQPSPKPPATVKAAQVMSTQTSPEPPLLEKATVVICTQTSPEPATEQKISSTQTLPAPLKAVQVTPTQTSPEPPSPVTVTQVTPTQTTPEPPSPVTVTQVTPTQTSPEPPVPMKVSQVTPTQTLPERLVPDKAALPEADIITVQAPSSTKIAASSRAISPVGPAGTAEPLSGPSPTRLPSSLSTDPTTKRNPPPQEVISNKTIEKVVMKVVPPLVAPRRVGGGFRTARATADFPAKGDKPEEGDLCFMNGEVVTVTARVDEEWLTGTTADGLIVRDLLRTKLDPHRLLGPPPHPLFFVPLPANRTFCPWYQDLHKVTNAHAFSRLQGIFPQSFVKYFD
jgi:hypothetical protein